MSTPLKIAIAGLGTVGSATFTLLRDHAALIEKRCGRPVVVSAISALAREREQIKQKLARPDLDALWPDFDALWHDDSIHMATNADADVIVELIGGADGPALALCKAALAKGRHVVTANKAMLAHHGTELAHAAQSSDVTLGFEAAVAGGIPIIKALREGLVSNQFKCIYGILNGTCNYILTTMRETKRDFGDVLDEAQSLGYAEADPSFDIDGIDTAHKLSILTSLAFGTPISFESVYVEGIRHIAAMDIDYAEQLGFRIKLLGMACLTEHGIEQRVHPCMVPQAAAIYHVDGVFNAVVAEGDYVGRSMYVGRGAGGGPTASAVVADIIDIAMGRRTPTFGVSLSALESLPHAPMAKRRGAYYVRLMVLDRPGVFADIAAALRDEGVSMDTVLQRSRSPGVSMPVVMTVHETEEAAMLRAMARIEGLDAVVEPPRLVRIEML